MKTVSVSRNTDRGWRIKFRRLEVHFVERMETLPRNEKAASLLKTGESD